MIKKRSIISILILAIIVFNGGCSKKSYYQKAENVLKDQVLKEADWAMKQKPITVTAEHSERSAGGIHDFYSEGDYWWPDPNNPFRPIYPERWSNKPK